MELNYLLKKRIEDLNWFKLNFKTIQENFGGNYIAIEGLTIIGSDKSHPKLLEKLENAGYDITQVLIKKVPNKNEFFVYYG